MKIWEDIEIDIVELLYDDVIATSEPPDFDDNLEGDWVD